MKTLIGFLLLTAPALGHGQGRALTIMDYFGGDARPGDVICEVVQLELGQTRCYLTTKLAATLTEQNDPSGTLKKGTISPNQRQFTKVEIGQLIAELGTGRIKREMPIDVYVKVAWEARDNGLLAKTLADSHIVHGRLTVAADGEFQFEVLNIPDMVLLGMYNPSLDVAEVFGRRIGEENVEIEQDFKVWLEAVVSAVIQPSRQLIAPVE